MTTFFDSSGCFHTRNVLITRYRTMANIARKSLDRAEGTTDIPQTVSGAQRLLRQSKTDQTTIDIQKEGR